MAVKNFQIIRILIQKQRNSILSSSVLTQPAINYRTNSSLSQPNNATADEDNFKHKGRRKFLQALTFGTLCSYALYKYRNEPELVPEVAAETLHSLVERKDQFHIISTVVKFCAPSVVYKEIKDTRQFDYDTGNPLTISDGSGFIIDSDGLILTNTHVVINKPHTMVQVKLSDGRTFPGYVEDLDQTSDLATVRINCNKLPVMKLGDSSTLESGEWVVALGSLLDLSNTFSFGVASSTMQELGLRNRDINYILTDAAISFDNSGGPLINLDGEAIGVNIMKVTAGLSFAIPIDYVKRFITRSAEKRVKGTSGKMILPSRRYMGITMLTLTPSTLMELKSGIHRIPENVTHGVLVWKVILGSPAHAGGLSPGDIVTHINDKEIKNSADVYDALGENKKILQLTIFRGLNQMKVSVTSEDP